MTRYTNSITLALLLTFAVVCLADAAVVDGRHRHYCPMPDDQYADVTIFLRRGAATTTTTLVALSDWSGDFVAWWDCEEATNNPRVADSSTECGAGSDCDLAESSGDDIGQDGTNYKVGSYACDFDTADTEQITCTGATCDELNIANNITFGTWARVVSDPTANVMGKTSGNNGYRMTRSAFNDRLNCQIFDGTDVITDLFDNALTTDAFEHVVCRFDDSNNEVEGFNNGAGSGSPEPQETLSAAGGDFYISGGSGAQWDGQIDEAFVIDHALTDESICRICSCNIDGSNCGCTPGDTASYSDTGRNVADCGSCDLDGPYGQFGCDETKAGVEPPDWSASFVAWWDFEQAAGANALANDLTSCGAAGTDCDLTQTNSPGRGTGVEGDYAVDYDSGTTEYHSCIDATCNELNHNDDITFGGWLNPETDSQMYILANSNTTSTGYDMLRATGANHTYRCRIYTATEGLVSQDTTADSAPISTWKHFVCTWDNSADEVTTFLNGAVEGCTPGSDCATATDMGSPTGRNFYLAMSAASWNGLQDEMFFIKDELTAAEVCRICSCGINGDECICSANDPTVYLDEGRNDTGTPNCGSCTLPDCNAAAP